VSDPKAVRVQPSFFLLLGCAFFCLAMALWCFQHGHPVGVSTFNNAASFFFGAAAFSPTKDGQVWK